jgi:starch phosphorylase
MTPRSARRWRAIKQHNKRTWPPFVEHSTGKRVDPRAMMDVMVKRLHEYKRQLLKLLHIVTLYQRLQDNRTSTSCRAPSSLAPNQLRATPPPS